MPQDLAQVAAATAKDIKITGESLLQLQRQRSPALPHVGMSGRDPVISHTLERVQAWHLSVSG